MELDFKPKKLKVKWKLVLNPKYYVMIPLQGTPS